MFEWQTCQYSIESRHVTRHRPLVVAIVYDGLALFEFGVVTEAFALPRPDIGVPWYRFQVCAAQRGPIRALGGLTVEVRNGLRALSAADTIVVPGWNIDEVPPAALLNAIRRAYARGARVVSICSGVFVLAAAGLLNGKRASTHWRYADRLAERFPDIVVERDVLYVDEGRVLTSAGSAAGIDLCLHIIRKDYGAAIANHVARRWVMPPHRDGGQSQYVTEAMHADSDAGQSSGRNVNHRQNPASGAGAALPRHRREPLAVHERSRAEQASKVMPQRRRRAEPHVFGHTIDPIVGGF